MILKIKVSCLLIIGFVSMGIGQMEDYRYKRALTGVTNQWHKITLPTDLFGKTSNSLADIRIFGVISNNDTIEVPYLIEKTTPEIFEKAVTFQQINQYQNEDGYFFTFEITDKTPINQIILDFLPDNFDWMIALSGSFDQKQWFPIVDDYRILSIKNEQIDYAFSKIDFQKTKYQYYRLQVKTDQIPDLRSATIMNQSFKAGALQTFGVKSIRKEENKKRKQTIVYLDLDYPVFVSTLQIDVKNNVDYYRPISIDYLADSVKTEKGWIHHYQPITSRTLTSFEKNIISFPEKRLQQLKIIIYNNDNEPLNIEKILAKGYLYELTARFDQKGDFFLTYGNTKANHPQYDINHFAAKIPKNLTDLSIGKEQHIPQPKQPKVEPLFKSKIWLWGIMLTIILLLGSFSLKMLQSKK